MSWTERQGQVGELTSHSKQELCEILSRQEHLLNNKRFVQKLPDKGKKISEFAERVRLAIARLEEQETKRDAPSFTEFQSKYQQAFSQQQRRGVDVLHNGPGDKEEDGRQTMETAAAVTAGGSLPLSDRTEESDLVEALGRVSLSHTSTTGGEALGRVSLFHTSTTGGESKEEADDITDNYFLGKRPQKTQQKSHYMEVLARNEHNQVPRRHKFKPNQLGPGRGDDDVDGSSPSRRSLSRAGRSSPGGGPSLSSSAPMPALSLSAQARKERDRKHLDDITAARLPLLHCQPARLLSMQESADLLLIQSKKQQELQAKQAAQKLSDGLRSSTSSSSTTSFHHHHHHPSTGPTAAYREEVQDDEDDDGGGEAHQLSSEED